MQRNFISISDMCAERKEENDALLMNNAIASGELKRWHSYQGSRRYARYGKQRGWERNCDPEQINRNSVETGANHFPAVKPADNFPL